MFTKAINLLTDKKKQVIDSITQSATGALLGQPETMVRAAPTVQNLPETMERAAPVTQNIQIPQQQPQVTDYSSANPFARAGVNSEANATPPVESMFRPAPVTQNISLPTTTPITKSDIEADPINYNNTPTKQGYNAALEELLGATKGEGLASTNAAISKDRQALLAANKQAEAKAGLMAQQSGALGQGTSNSLVEKTRQSALQEMSNQELGFAKLRGDDQKAAIDKVISAEQAEKGSVIAAEGATLARSGQNLTVEQMNRNFANMDASLKEQIATRMQNGEQFNFQRLDEMNKFNATMKMQEKQWTAEFGSKEGKDYMNALLELSVDNPVLAQKIQTHLLSGNTGTIGDFTPAETVEIQRLKGLAETREQNIDNIYAKTLELTGLQIDKEKGSVVGELAGEATQKARIDNFISTGDYASMQSADWDKLVADPNLLALAKDKITTWESMVDLKDKLRSYPSMLDRGNPGYDEKVKEADANLQQYIGKVILHNNVPYRISGFSSGATQAINLLNNQPVYI